MTESTQNPGPTKGGNTVSVVGSGGRRRDYSDSHQCPIRLRLVALRPFPDVPDHRPASEGTLTFPERTDIDTTHRSPIKISALRRRRIVTPGKFSFMSADSLPISCWFGARGHLPFRFSW